MRHTILAAVASAAIFQPSGATGAWKDVELYANDFESSILGWSPDPGGYINAGTDVWGGTNDQYWSPSPTPTDQQLDRALTMYKSGSGGTLYWALDLSNTLSVPIDQIRIAYDLENPWSRHDSNRLRIASVDWWFNTGSGWMAAGSSPTVGNQSVTDTGEEKTSTTWLTDAQMNALSLAARGLSLTISDLEIPVSGAFSVRFGARGGTSNEKNMNFGIDNLRITTPVEVVPAPSTLALMSLAGVMLLLARHRVTRWRMLSMAERS